LRTGLDRKTVGVRDHGDVAKMQKELKELTQKTGTEDLNARQLAARMRGTVCYEADPSVHPPWCDDLPPQEPNAYCDGSVSNPAQKQFALGGSGVWHK
jgi:hypothetical protein